MKKITLIFLALIVVLVGVGIFYHQSTRQPFSYAPDYSWIAGELYYSPLEGGFWGIRYGEKGEDKYDGHFVLGKTLRGDFKDGDLVLIKGQIAEEQMSIFMAGWIYKVEKIEKLDNSI